MVILPDFTPPDKNKSIVTFRKSGNILEISNEENYDLQPEVRVLLEPVLSYNKIEFVFGANRYSDITGTKQNVRILPKQLYRYDAGGRMICAFGFYKKLYDLLINNGYGVKFVNIDVPIEKRPRPLCYTPDWQAVFYNFQFYPRQLECLQSIVNNPCGVVHAVTGFGKMVLIAMICVLFPKAKIDVVTRRRDLVNKLRQFLTKWIPNVGQVGAGRESVERVTVYTAASLHKNDFSADWLICDEGHELLSDESSKWLVKYKNSKNILLTASPSGRSDNTDIRMEGIFGPKIFYISYQEAVDLGLVVPIKVEWTDVFLPSNPCASLDGVAKERRGLWRNQGRNEIIARKARSFGENEQVQILVKTVEHAVYLKQFLPEFTLVYDTLELKDKNRYIKNKLLDESEPEMTPQRRENLRKAFEEGELKKVISTNVWSTGIDARGLSVLIRADAMSSEIVDIQAPGRVSRKAKDGSKNYGIVCDFWDQFDRGYYNKAKKRSKHYNEMGWSQETVKLDSSTG